MSHQVLTTQLYLCVGRKKTKTTPAERGRAQSKDQTQLCSQAYQLKQAALANTQEPSGSNQQASVSQVFDQPESTTNPSSLQEEPTFSMATQGANAGAAAPNTGSHVSSFKMPYSWDRNRPTFDSDDHEELLTYVDQVEEILDKAGITVGAERKHLGLYTSGTFDEFVKEVFQSYPEVKSEETGSVEALNNICKKHKGITVSQVGKLRCFGIEFTAEAKKLMRGKALTTNLQVCHMYLETLDPAFSVVLKVTVSSAQLMRNHLGVQAPAAVIGPAIAPRKKGDPIDLVDLIKMAEDMTASQPEGGSTFDILPEKEITRATHFPTIKQEPSDEKMEEINGVLATLRDAFLTSQTQQHEHHSEILKLLQQVAKGVPLHKDIPIANSGNQNQGSNNYQPERWNNPAKSTDNNRDCFYCELQGHISRNCPHKEEHINKGWLGIENGKTRLGNGGFIPRGPGTQRQRVEDYWCNKTVGQQLFVQKQGPSQAQSLYYQSDENESQQDWTETAMDEIRTLKVRLAKAESVNNQNNLSLANTHRAVQPAFMASTQADASFTQELDLGQTLQALLLKGIQAMSENQNTQDQFMAATKNQTKSNGGAPGSNF
ncbi:hypothetical protein B0H17DRAFT_1125629 [Mycena rosella]|uniref:CCHC-type domain-containing protein n=1 Tax=Mycena rosella TaxID=1033263 RepID=A0AAD7M9D9_MYCRO|nr:hypothetical protein B0H17DRAFT_1125629 [Mycena rosella]